MKRRGAKIGSSVRRVTANLPLDVLSAAQRETGKGITETLIQGLEVLRARAGGRRLLALAGKIPPEELEIDLESSRERRRH